MFISPLLTAGKILAESLTEGQPLKAMSATKRTPDPRNPSAPDWDRALINQLDASYSSEHGTVVYDADLPEAWIESTHSIRRGNAR